MASVSAGKSRTLATVASFGLKPAWDACFHIVLKSGGVGALVNSCAPLLLKVAILLLESVVARERGSSAIVRIRDRNDFVGAHPVPHRDEAFSELLHAEEEHRGEVEAR